MPFSPEELAAMAAADAEIEKNFRLTQEDLDRSKAMDREAHFESLSFEKKKVAAQRKAYREANREKVAAQQKAYREANREKYNLYMREYMKKRREHDQSFDSDRRRGDGTAPDDGYENLP